MCCSDLCAGLVGGLGLTPSGNIGEDGAIFESVSLLEILFTAKGSSINYITLKSRIFYPLPTLCNAI